MKAIRIVVFFKKTDDGYCLMILTKKPNENKFSRGYAHTSTLAGGKFIQIRFDATCLKLLREKNLFL
jgi:hypothetical protein